MAKTYSDSQIAAATAFHRENVAKFHEGPQTQIFEQNARSNGTWVAATGRGSATPQQTV